MDEVRDAKAAVIRQFRQHGDFLGAGIGRGKDGRLVVQVNWRALPAGIERPDRIGSVEVTHQAIGTIVPFRE